MVLYSVVCTNTDGNMVVIIAKKRASEVSLSLTYFPNSKHLTSSSDGVQWRLYLHACKKIAPEQDVHHWLCGFQLKLTDDKANIHRMEKI